MKPLGSVLALLLTAVLDQMDGGWALVEWDDGSLGHLPVDRFPPGVTEGDLLGVRLGPPGGEAPPPSEAPGLPRGIDPSRPLLEVVVLQPSPYRAPSQE